MKRFLPLIGDLIGSYDDWIKFSDHVPVIVEI